MGTLGRSREIREFIDSLLSQAGDCTWELIIVDQNEDERVSQILAASLTLPLGCNLVHIQTSRRGLSAARNRGLEVATGKIIAFPDDDCRYSQNVLNFVSEELHARRPRPLDGITLADTSDASKLETMTVARRHRLTSYGIFRYAISYTIFVSGRFRSYRFDEQFGVGAQYGAAEETDFLFKLLSAGANLEHVTGPLIFHPDKSDGYKNVVRAYSYNVGIGAFFRKNLSRATPGLWAFFCISSLKLCLRLIQISIWPRGAELSWYWAIATGRINGWSTYSARTNPHD